MRTTNSEEQERRDLLIVECLAHAEILPEAEREPFAKTFFSTDQDALDIVRRILSCDREDPLASAWQVLQGPDDSESSRAPFLNAETAEFAHASRKDTVEVCMSERSLPSIPGHQLGAEIGRGGMAIVVEAFDQGLEIDVAIKLIGEKMMETETARRRFRGEARAVAKLRHPNIVGILREGETEDGVLWFSMERVIGDPLNKVIADEQLTIDRIVEIIRGIAEALSYAHKQKILHRDIKPANVILDEQGQPKVVDFGLAKNVDSDESYTREGYGMGTPDYMAPEQISTVLGTLSPATDLYGLGGVLYAMLTGRPPFQHQDPLELSQAVLHQPATSPVSNRLDVPKDLRSICLKCLEKRPRNRYQNADLLIADLDRFSRGVPVNARPIGPLVRTTRWIQRNPIATTVLTTLSLLLLVVGFLWNRSNQNQAIAEQRAVTLATQKAEIVAKAESLADANEAMQQQLYGAGIRDADHLLNVGRYETAFQRLTELIPSPNETDRRSIEWGILWNRLVGPFRMQFACGSFFGSPHQYFSLSHDNRTLAFADYGVTYLWDYHHGILQRRIKGISVPRYLGDKKSWAFVSAGKVLVCDTNSLTPRVTWKGEDQVLDIASNEDGSQIAIVCIQGDSQYVEVISCEDGKRIFQTPPVQGRCRAVCFSPNGRLLALAYQNRQVHVYEIESEKLTTLEGGYVPIGLDFSPDGRYLIACPLGYRARIWRTDGWELETELVGNDKAWRMARFTPDGKNIVMAGFGGRIWYYRVSDWKLLERHNADLTVWFGDISPSGQHLIVGGRTGKRNQTEGFASGGGRGLRVFHLDRDFEQGFKWHDWGDRYNLPSRQSVLGPHSTCLSGKYVSHISSRPNEVLRFTIKANSWTKRRTVPFAETEVRQIQSFGLGRFTGYLTKDGQAGYIDWTDRSRHALDVPTSSLILCRDDQHPDRLWIVADQKAYCFSHHTLSRIESFDLPFKPTLFKRCDGYTFLATGNSLTVLDENMLVRWEQTLDRARIHCIEPLGRDRVIVSSGKTLFEIHQEGIRRWPDLHASPIELHSCNIGERLLVVHRWTSVSIYDTHTRRLLCEAPVNDPREVGVGPEGQWISVRDNNLRILKSPRDGDILEDLLQMVVSGESHSLVQTALKRQLAWSGKSPTTIEIAETFLQVIELEHLLPNPKQLVPKQLAPSTTETVGSLPDTSILSVLSERIQRSLKRLATYQPEGVPEILQWQERLLPIVERFDKLQGGGSSQEFFALAGTCRDSLSEISDSLAVQMEHHFENLGVGESQKISDHGWSRLVTYDDRAVIRHDSSKLWFIALPGWRKRLLAEFESPIAAAAVNTKEQCVYVGTSGKWNAAAGKTEYSQQTGVFKVAIASGNVTELYRASEVDFWSVRLTADRKFLIVSGSGTQVQRIDLESGKIDTSNEQANKSAIQRIEGSSRGAVFFPNSNVAAVLYPPSHIAVVNTKTGKQIQDVNVDIGYTPSLRIGPDSKSAYFCDLEGQMHRVFASSDLPPQQWKISKDRIYGFTILPKYHCAVYTTKEGTFLTKLPQ